MLGVIDRNWLLRSDRLVVVIGVSRSQAFNLIAPARRCDRIRHEVVRLLHAAENLLL